MTETLQIGYGAFILKSKVVWVAPFEGSALKRLRKIKEQEAKAIDLTFGHSASSVIGTTDGAIIISPVSAAALLKRTNKEQ